MLAPSAVSLKLCCLRAFFRGSPLKHTSQTKIQKLAIHHYHIYQRPWLRSNTTCKELRSLSLQRERDMALATSVLRWLRSSVLVSTSYAVVPPCSSVGIFKEMTETHSSFPLPPSLAPLSLSLYIYIYVYTKLFLFLFAILQKRYMLLV